MGRSLRLVCGHHRGVYWAQCGRIVTTINLGHCAQQKFCLRPSSFSLVLFYFSMNRWRIRVSVAQFERDELILIQNFVKCRRNNFRTSPSSPSPGCVRCAGDRRFSSRARRRPCDRANAPPWEYRRLIRCSEWQTDDEGRDGADG